MISQYEPKVPQSNINLPQNRLGKHTTEHAGRNKIEEEEPVWGEASN
jgi:hypothetical protein